MKTNPAVSVLIPAYNVEAYVREAIGSVLVQSFTDWEIVAVDDGSTDRTVAIMRSVAAEDARIRVIEARTNVGVTANWNRCLAHARGISW